MLKSIVTFCLLFLIGGLGAFFSWTQAGRSLEEEVGLTWLFQLRGAQQPPPDVIIISLDQLSAEILHLSDNPDLWPRSFYATLIEKLNQQNPALIAFNIHFGQSREADKDDLLVKAMNSRKNVVLSNYLKQITIPAKDGAPSIHYEHIIEPLDQFRQAALGAAPFPLPKSSSTVKEFWSYKNSAGDMATLPVSIFQFYALQKAYPEVLDIFNRINPALLADLPASYEELIKQAKTDQAAKLIQAYLTKNSDILKQFEHFLDESKYSSEAIHLLRAWLALFKANKRLYLNYYGEVGAITTVPFYQVLATDSRNQELFRNKLVLVGYGEDLEPEKQQGFYSAYSKASGEVINPIEIAATALANILEKNWLKPLPTTQKVLFVFVWGILLSGLFRFLVFRRALALTISFNAAYFSLSLYLFQSQQLWLPLAVPVLQTVLVVLLESTKHYLKIKKLTAYYLPKEVFAINTHYAETMNDYGNLLQGACMATDAGQYTALSESIDPLELNKLMNDYYATIFPKVKKSGGLITDVIGDAMLAVWVDKKADIKNRQSAASAALQIAFAITEFNRKAPYFLTTRIGVHFGSMRLGNVGAMEHYEFRAVGDTINTVARIEGLNKILGTQILASSSAVEDLSGMGTRELGMFLLKGKTNPIKIYELFAIFPQDDNPADQAIGLLELFELALQQFKAGKWETALSLFMEIKHIYPHDGPTSFYIDYLQNRLSSSSSIPYNRDVIIDLGTVPTFLH